MAGRGTNSKTLADLLPLAARALRRRARGPLQGRRAAGSTAASPRSLEIVRAAGARPDRARGREGRPGLDPRQHPPRVDLLRLRGALDRRHRGPDLPDQLARGVPLRARELRRQGRRRRGRRAAGEDPRGPRPAAAARAGGADDRRQPTTRSRWRTWRAKGAGVDAARWEQRYSAVTPDDICTFIYTSGTTGPPKGCIISHGNYRAMLDMVNETSVIEDDDVSYLYLPLAHSFALLIQLGSFDLGATIAYWERDPLKIIPNLAELKPTYFPSVPRIFEKIYTAANSGMEKEGGLKKAIFDWSIRVGAKMREAERSGRKPGFLLQPPVRLRRQAGALENPRPVRRQPAPRGLRRRPDQPRDPALLRRRRRARARGLGDDRDLDRGDDLHSRRLQGRHDRQAVPRLRGEDRRRRRDPRQGPQRLPGLPQERGGDRARRSSTAGSTPATSARSTPTASSRSPAAKRTSSSPPGGKNITPANLEAEIKQHPLVSQCVVVGDRRPYLVALVTLDPEEAVAYAKEHGLPEDPAQLAANPEIRAVDRGPRREDQRELRPGRAGQEDRDPPPRPLPGERRADADAEGQAGGRRPKHERRSRALRGARLLVRR